MSKNNISAEQARNREIVRAMVNDPATKVQPLNAPRQKRRISEVTELANAKAAFRRHHGDAWDNKYAKKKAERKAAQKAKA